MEVCILNGPIQSDQTEMQEQAQLLPYQSLVTSAALGTFLH